MDFFQHRYYRLNKTLMTLIGQWPHQSTGTRRGFLALTIYLSTSQIASRLLSFVKYRHDWYIVLDCASVFLGDLVSVTNLIGFMWNSQRTLKLLNRIRTDWRVWSREREVAILHRYAQQGEKINIVYAAMTYWVLFVLTLEPMVSKVIDLLAKNGTRPGKYPVFVDYYHLDGQKYYFYISVYTYVVIFVLATLIVTNNVMLVSYVEHSCGTFAALGQKLQRIGNDVTSIEAGESPYALEKREMVHLAWCIDRHNDAIEYVNLIEATYTWNLFFTIVFGMILINVIGLQILMNTNDSEVIAKFVAYALALISQFCMESYVSQFVIDHSTDIRVYAYNSEWYRLSLKARNVLKFMIMRCSVPCQLTAGKIFIMSVTSFGLTIRTAASYFTFLRSTQGL